MAYTDVMEGSDLSILLLRLRERIADLEQADAARQDAGALLTLKVDKAELRVSSRFLDVENSLARLELETRTMLNSLDEQRRTAAAQLLRLQHLELENERVAHLLARLAARRPSLWRSLKADLWRLRRKIA